MALELNGTTGVSLVQDGVITDANLPAGSVLQVVSSTTITPVTFLSSTYVTMGLSASITPSSTSSKILVMIQGGEIDTLRSGDAVYFTIYGGGSDIASATAGFASHWGDSSRIQTPLSMMVLAEPSTTSSITYELYARGNNANSRTFCNNQARCSMVLMEIAG